MPFEQTDVVAQEVPDALGLADVLHEGCTTFLGDATNLGFGFGAQDRRLCLGGAH
ncbi:unannotated protein [freshwater metagenome]|uniref:Unannotated protein n=1 Tax=freshwater metagenome TaxID=449393 RepID=A0A6J7J3R2_9ZZZZ